MASHDTWINNDRSFTATVRQRTVIILALVSPRFITTIDYTQIMLHNATRRWPNCVETVTSHIRFNATKCMLQGNAVRIWQERHCWIMIALKFITGNPTTFSSQFRHLRTLRKNILTHVQLLSGYCKKCFVTFTSSNFLDKAIRNTFTQNKDIKVNAYVPNKYLEYIRIMYVNYIYIIRQCLQFLWRESRLLNYCA